ncbi:family 10 glycosylhydrolase [bacterium]|nr:family 10 glycosylhydrolase [bacterium]
MLKKIIISLFIFCFGLIGYAQELQPDKNEIIFKQSTYKINAINPTPISNARGSYFPGLRGSNQLIIYTKDFGLRTNTNEFGSEAIVDGNTVVSLSGADSVIPYNGFVISGHGSAKTWINKNITVGSKVYVDEENNLLKVYLTSESYLYEAKTKVREAEALVEYYKKQHRNYNYQAPCLYINKANSYIKKAKRNPKNIEQYSAMAVEAANMALKYSIPYDKNELKGVWIRPTETTPMAVAQTVARIKSAGINEIFLETYFHGMTIFPSQTMTDYGFYTQNPIFNGVDVLKLYIDEAHKRNMKVNIWFETFYIGNKVPQEYPQNILNIHPEWANVDKLNVDSQTLAYSKSEHNGYFLDPANPDVQMFLETLLREIICDYQPDGINLDYVRYPQSQVAKYPSSYVNSNWGYTNYAREEFIQKYDKDPLDLTYNDDLWIMWDKYRQDKISAFILRINEITKHKDINLTTVIFPDMKRALETKQQDWSTWSLTNSLNGVTPLFLTCDAQTTQAMLNEIIRNTSPSTKIYAGLFTTFMSGSQEDLLRQIHVIRQSKVDGIILFDFAHLADSYINTLNTCVFNPNLNNVKKNKKKSKSKKKRK